MARSVRCGVGHDQQGKVLSNIRSEGVSIPNIYALIKDHKVREEGRPVKTRPVCGAVESPNGQLSNLLADIINNLTMVEDEVELQGDEGSS